ncbi:hypothetical protein J2S53_001709 [Actinopolyspora lacussalsi]|nr:hypothetical protein [Actinopolyspora lacussalsi]
MTGAGTRIEALHEHDSTPRVLPRPGDSRDAHWDRLPRSAPLIPLLFTPRVSLPG